MTFACRHVRAHARTRALTSLVPTRARGQSYAIPIALATVDEYVASNQISDLRFIKIDTEFHDFEVLQGAKRTLETMRPLVFHESQGARQSLVDEWMAERGYVCFAWNQPQGSARLGGDFLFVPSEMRRIHANWFSVSVTGHVMVNVLVTGLGDRFSLLQTSLRTQVTVLLSGTTAEEYVYTFTGTAGYKHIPLSTGRMENIHGLIVVVSEDDQPILNLTRLAPYCEVQ